MNSSPPCRSCEYPAASGVLRKRATTQTSPDSSRKTIQSPRGTGTSATSSPMSCPFRQTDWNLEQKNKHFYNNSTVKALSRIAQTLRWRYQLLFPYRSWAIFRGSASRRSGRVCAMPLWTSHRRAPSYLASNLKEKYFFRLTTIKYFNLLKTLTNHTVGSVSGLV